MTTLEAKVEQAKLIDSLYLVITHQHEQIAELKADKKLDAIEIERLTKAAADWERTYDTLAALVV